MQNRAELLTEDALNELKVTDTATLQVIQDYESAFDKWLAPGAYCATEDFSQAVHTDHYSVLENLDVCWFVK